MNNLEIKVSDYIAEFLCVQEVNYVFEVAGGMITHLLDAIYRLGNTNIVSVHHEQSAAFAADAYGRTTGKPGVALATSGPGATNLLTGIASCYFDSSPAIFITGQVNVHEQKGTRGIRQLGFQETDIVSMAAPITKKSFRVSQADQIESLMHEAFETAISGRPGPVLIDLPMNIQREKIIVGPISSIKRKKIDSRDLKIQLARLSELLLKAKHPLILVGGGTRPAKSEFLKFIELTQIPVVSSLLGIDLIAFNHPLRVGFIGTYGNRWANMALGKSDLLIVLGSRLDIRQTGADIEGFRKNKTIIHIDCDPNEINNRIQECIAITADTQTFLSEANNYLPPLPASIFASWKNEINTLRDLWPDTNELKSFQGINPNRFMHALSGVSQHAISYVADVGNHQMWAAQSLEIGPSQEFLTSGGMGAMGFALPAAIGASLAHQKKPVLVIAGDGAFQMNIQELQTIVRNKIPLKIIILNNNCLGMIRQFQDSYFEGRYQSTYWGYSAPDFAEIAQAYGIMAKTICFNEEINDSLGWLWQEPNVPSLLQVMINPHMNVYPKIAFGRPIDEMEPFFIPVSIEST